MKDGLTKRNIDTDLISVIHMPIQMNNPEMELMFENHPKTVDALAEAKGSHVFDARYKSCLLTSHVAQEPKLSKVWLSVT